MKEELFEYPIVRQSELKLDYPEVPYRFSQEIRDYTDYLFTHPYNKHNKIYNKLHKPYDSNDMLKSAYRIYKYYCDYPQQFNYTFNNLHMTMLVNMWKSFIVMHKHLRGEKFNLYMKTDSKLMKVGDGRILDMLIEEVNQKKYTWHNDDMVKKRKGIGLRERRGYSERSLHYYDSLE